MAGEEEDAPQETQGVNPYAGFRMDPIEDQIDADALEPIDEETEVFVELQRPHPETIDRVVYLDEDTVAVYFDDGSRFAGSYDIANQLYDIDGFEIEHEEEDDLDEDEEYEDEDDYDEEGEGDEVDEEEELADNLQFVLQPMYDTAGRQYGVTTARTYRMPNMNAPSVLYPSVGGADSGCDCTRCRELRLKYYESRPIPKEEDIWAEWPMSE